MTLSTRLSLAMVTLVFVAAAAIGLLAYRALERALYPAQLARMEGNANVLAERLAVAVDDAGADAILLAGTPATEGLMRALQGSDRLEQLEWKERLAQLFRAALVAKSEYLQIRLLDAEGMEIVRAERSSEDGKIAVVPPESLQAKDHRPYFVEAVKLAEGQIYTSPIELNQEHGAVELPHVPVLRAATAVYGPDHRTRGVVVVNVNLGPALDRLRFAADPASRVYAVNQRGDYLVHPDRGREFGSDLGRPSHLQDDFPGLAEVARLSGDASWPARTVEDAVGGRHAAAAAARRLGSDAWVAVVLTAPASEVLAPADAILLSTSLAGIGAILIAVLLAAAVSRSIVRPLDQVTTAFERFDRGEPAMLPDRAPGEIGILANAFRRHVERERLFNAAVESSSDAVLTRSLDGVITAWNRAAETLYGYTAAEAIGRPIRMLVPQDRIDEFETVQKRLGAGEPTATLETDRVTKDGQRINVSLSVSPVRSFDGEVIGASEISRDITLQRRSDALFRLAVESCPAAMVMVDQRGLILLANSEAREVFGYEPEELIGKPIEMLVPERFRSAHSSLRGEFAGQPDKRIMGVGRELYGLHRDGSEFPVEVGLNPMRTSTGPLVLSVVVDITERERAAAELRQQTLELERSNAELQQFAYVASHDLQEPLRMVSSFCELIKERYADRLDEDGLEFIDFAVDGASRMRQLINDLLDYSRLQTRDAELGAVSAEQALRRALLDLAEAIRECHAEIRHDPLPSVLANETQLVRLFQNLIGNALKFRSSDRPTIEITAVAQGDDWIISVRDDGIGIDPRQSNAIFGVFHRLHTRDEYPGTGIGLAICKRIVERHGGKIWVESAPGKGTTFRFTLSAAARPPGAPTEQVLIEGEQIPEDTEAIDDRRTG